MKSRRTHKRNSRRKVRMSRKHQGGEETHTDVPTVEPITTEPITTEPIPAPTQEQLDEMEKKMREAGEELIVQMGLAEYIIFLKNLIETNKKDAKKNIVMNISNQTESNQIEENQTKEVAKKITNIIITIQEKLLTEYEERLKRQPLTKTNSITISNTTNNKNKK